MTDNANTWYKLKDGTWGAKLRQAANVGDCVTLTTKKGEEKQVYLVNKVAQFPDASLWTCSLEPVGAVAEEEPF